MPYPDSEYPSILRGRDKRESQRLLEAAPALLAALKALRPDACSHIHCGHPSCQQADAAIAKAEGRN